MAVSQPEFIQALLDPAAPVPKGLASKSSKNDKRFAVYRNNVAFSLSDALSVAFPVVYRLVGEKFFRAMAGLYVRRYPPRSPMLMYFGKELPEFLEGFEPARSLPYLPDVARLEIAMRESYHAEDSQLVDPFEVMSAPAEILETATVGLAPSLRLLRSQYPIFQIWKLNTSGDRVENHDSEDVMVARRQYDPVPERLSKGDYEFVSALADGKTLGLASRAALQASVDFDLHSISARLIDAKAIVKIVPSKKKTTFANGLAELERGSG